MASAFLQGESPERNSGLFAATCSGTPSIVSVNRFPLGGVARLRIVERSVAMRASLAASELSVLA